MIIATVVAVVAIIVFIGVVALAVNAITEKMADAALAVMRAIYRIGRREPSPQRESEPVALESFDPQAATTERLMVHIFPHAVASVEESTVFRSMGNPPFKTAKVKMLTGDEFVVRDEERTAAKLLLAKREGGVE